MKQLSPFHLAIPVHNLELCRVFYRDTLGCKEGRSSKNWVDFNFYGHQLVIHYKPKEENDNSHTNPVDGKDVPVPHFGVVLPWGAFHELATQLKQKNVNFIIEPYIMFEGLISDLGFAVIKDPSGNALEFKSFKDMKQLFAK